MRPKIKQQGFLIKKGNRYYIDSKKTASILLNQLHVDLLLHFKQYITGKLLDVGCGEKPYCLIYDELTISSVGCDVENCIHGKNAIDIYATADNLPFDDESFDTVLCTNVLEHVSESFKGFSEIARVTKPGGYLICSTPFLYPLHEAPYDYYRYTTYALKHQLEKNGMTIETMIPLGGFGMMVMVYFNLFVTRLLKSKLLNIISCGFQHMIYPLYKSICFRKICSGVTSISNIVSCGYFVVAKKQEL